MKAKSKDKDQKKSNKKTSKSASAKKATKKEALGSGWHPLLLLVLSLLAGAWMMFR
jgi:hypothetical protein